MPRAFQAGETGSVELVTTVAPPAGGSGGAGPAAVPHTPGIATDGTPLAVSAAASVSGGMAVSEVGATQQQQQKHAVDHATGSRVADAAVEGQRAEPPPTSMAVSALMDTAEADRGKGDGGAFESDDLAAASARVQVRGGALRVGMRESHSPPPLGTGIVKTEPTPSTNAQANLLKPVPATLSANASLANFNSATPFAATAVAPPSLAQNTPPTAPLGVPFVSAATATASDSASAVPSAAAGRSASCAASVGLPAIPAVTSLPTKAVDTNATLAPRPQPQNTAAVSAGGNPLAGVVHTGLAPIRHPLTASSPTAIAATAVVTPLSQSVNVTNPVQPRVQTQGAGDAVVVKVEPASSSRGAYGIASGVTGSHPLRAVPSTGMPIATQARPSAQQPHTPAGHQQLCSASTSPMTQGLKQQQQQQQQQRLSPTTVANSTAGATAAGGPAAAVLAAGPRGPSFRGMAPPPRVQSPTVHSGAQGSAVPGATGGTTISTAGQAHQMYAARPPPGPAPIPAGRGVPLSPRGPRLPSAGAAAAAAAAATVAAAAARGQAPSQLPRGAPVSTTGLPPPRGGQPTPQPTTAAAPVAASAALARQHQPAPRGYTSAGRLVEAAVPGRGVVPGRGGVATARGYSHSPAVANPTTAPIVTSVSAATAAAAAAGTNRALPTAPARTHGSPAATVAPPTAPAMAGMRPMAVAARGVVYTQAQQAGPHAIAAGRGTGTQVTAGGARSPAAPPSTPAGPEVTSAAYTGTSPGAGVGTAAAPSQALPGYPRAMVQGVTQSHIMSAHRGMGVHDPAGGRMTPGGAPLNAAGGTHGGGGGGGADGEDGGPARENTGRWTYDEHRLFLRGLDLHGRGWKKIASLIKTRTVVQIRTHAQKYFQKLAKAKQNGDHGEVPMDKGNGSRRRSRGRRRMEDLLRGSTAVAPSLQPYVAGAGAVETGLYRFLSPIILHNLETPSSAGHTSGGGGYGGRAMGVGGAGGGVSGNGVHTQPYQGAAAMASEAQAAAAAVLPPNWYRAGRGVDDLLSEAEGLDWLADSGGAGGIADSAAAAAAVAAAATGTASAPSALPATTAAHITAAHISPAAAPVSTSVAAGTSAIGRGISSGVRDGITRANSIGPLPGSAPPSDVRQPSLKRARSNGTSPPPLPTPPGSAPNVTPVAPTAAAVTASDSQQQGMSDLTRPVVTALAAGSPSASLLSPTSRPLSLSALTASTNALGRDSYPAALAALPAAAAVTIATNATITTPTLTAAGTRLSLPSQRQSPTFRTTSPSTARLVAPMGAETVTSTGLPTRVSAGAAAAAAAAAEAAAAAVAAAFAKTQPAPSGSRPNGGSPLLRGRSTAADAGGGGDRGTTNILISVGGAGKVADGVISPADRVSSSQPGEISHSAGLTHWTAPSLNGEHSTDAAVAGLAAIDIGGVSGDGHEGVGDLSPAGLQGSDAEEGHLSGLSDLEGLMEDQDMPGSPPFGRVSHGDRSPSPRREADGGGVDDHDDAMHDRHRDSSGDHAGSAASTSVAAAADMDEGMVDEDAFVAALLDA